MTGDTRSVVRAYVSGHPGATPVQVASATGLGREVVKKTLQRLASAGTLRSDGRGHYFSGGRRHLAPVPASGDSHGDTGAAGTVSPAGRGDTLALPDGEHGDSSPADRWRCGHCHWLQAIGSVEHCEFCGASRSREVPR